MKEKTQKQIRRVNISMNCDHRSYRRNTRKWLTCESSVTLPPAFNKFVIHTELNHLISTELGTDW